MDAPRLKAVEARLFLARAVAGQPGEAQLAERVAAAPGDLTAACALASRQFLAGRVEPALERWLDVLGRNRSFGDDLARRSLLHALELLEGQDELVHRYRRRMMALLH
jgi:putative thioredoxin